MLEGKIVGFLSELTQLVLINLLVLVMCSWSVNLHYFMLWSDDTVGHCLLPHIL